MLIVVKVVGGVSGFVEPPGANRPGPGHRFFFSDNLVLEEIDGKKPGPVAFHRRRKTAVQARSRDLSRPFEPQTRPIRSLPAATSCCSTRARTG
jgi:hypothetical protein